MSPMSISRPRNASAPGIIVEEISAMNTSDKLAAVLKNIKTIQRAIKKMTPITSPVVSISMRLWGNATGSPYKIVI